MTRINIFLFAMCSLFIAGVIWYIDYSESKKLYFTVEMEAFTRGGIGQIFFDKGHGYNALHTSALQVQRGVLQKYSFPLPTFSPIKSIRFDPINVASVLSIKNAVIENAQGDTLKIFPVQSFRSVQQISRMDISEDVLVIHTTEDAYDPIIKIENSSFERKISCQSKTVILKLNP